MDASIYKLMRPRKVCLCRSVSNQDIEKAVENGATTMVKLVNATAATTGCGTCILDVKCALEEAKEKLAEKKSPQVRLSF